MSQKQDRRIRKTQAALKTAMLQILREKPIEKVTVSELCRFADINRSSFYRYYSEPSVILKDLEEDYYAEFSKQWSEMEDLSSSVARTFVNKIYEFREYSTVLFGPNGNTQLLDDLPQYAYEHSMTYFKAYKSKADEKTIEFIYVFLLHGTIAIVMRWINGGFTESPDEIADLVEGLSARGLSAFLKLPENKK